MKSDHVVTVSCIAAVACVLATIGFLVNRTGMDVWLAVLTALVLFTLAMPISRWIAAKEGDPALGRIILTGFVYSLAMSMVRYFFLEIVYDGNGDAGRYHATGVIWLQRLLAGQPLHPIALMTGYPAETQRVGDITGFVYLFTGPSYFAGFLAFATIGFAGRVFMLRAFRVAVPEADHRRYDLLVLFLPSLAFWPGSIGKEAVMIGCLGVISYGGALLLAPKPRARGALIFAVGLVLVLLIRPHVALMAVGSLVVATGIGVLGGFRGGRSRTKGRMVRLAALVLLLLATSVASTRASAIFKSDDGTVSTGNALEQTLAETSRGGSEFAPLTATSPAQLPGAIASVLFRPLPWEARSVNSLVAAAEGAILLLLLALSWRRVASFPKLALRRPYLVFAAGFVVTFSIGFSFVANFGILSRQRTQMLPMVLVLLALPPIPRRPKVKPRASEAPSGTVTVGDVTADSSTRLEPVLGTDLSRS
jgi:hypothetical protein